jgi:hypothetical protein
MNFVVIIPPVEFDGIVLLLEHIDFLSLGVDGIFLLHPTIPGGVRQASVGLIAK